VYWFDDTLGVLVEGISLLGAVGFVLALQVGYLPYLVELRQPVVCWSCGGGSWHCVAGFFMPFVWGVGGGHCQGCFAQFHPNRRGGDGWGIPVYVQHAVYFGGARPGPHGWGWGRGDWGGGDSSSAIFGMDREGVLMVLLMLRAEVWVVFCAGGVTPYSSTRESVSSSCGVSGRVLGWVDVLGAMGGGSYWFCVFWSFGLLRRGVRWAGSLCQ